MKLNLWCDFDIRAGYVNMDRIAHPGVDIVQDLESAAYPFEENTFQEVYTSMVLEHIHNLSALMDELVRICQDGAHIHIIVPYFSSPNLWGDMTHVRGFNTNTFSGYHSNSLKSFSQIELVTYRIHFLSNGKFMQSAPINILPDFFINLFPKVYERFFCYLFPASEIHYTLRVKK